MPATKGQSFQDKIDSLLLRLGLIVGSSRKSTEEALDEVVNHPLRMYGTFPTPDSKLLFEPARISQPDGSEKTANASGGGDVPIFPASNIDFQAQTTGGGTFSIAFPASTVGLFRRVGFTLLSTGTMNVVFSAEAASIGALADPATLIGAGIKVGWIDLEATDVAGKFKTVGSATDIIENSVSSVSRIVNFDPGEAAPPGGFDVDIILVDDVTGDVLTDDITGNVLTNT